MPPAYRKQPHPDADAGAATPRVGSLAPWLAVAALTSARLAAAGADVKSPLDAAQADRFARLALACLHREYPNKIAHALNGDDDIRPPAI